MPRVYRLQWLELRIIFMLEGCEVERPRQALSRARPISRGHLPLSTFNLTSMVYPACVAIARQQCPDYNMYI